MTFASFLRLNAYFIKCKRLRCATRGARAQRSLGLKKDSLSVNGYGPSGVAERTDHEHCDHDHGQGEPCRQQGSAQCFDDAVVQVHQEYSPDEPSCACDGSNTGRDAFDNSLGPAEHQQDCSHATSGDAQHVPLGRIHFITLSCHECWAGYCASLPPSNLGKE